MGTALTMSSMGNAGGTAQASAGALPGAMEDIARLKEENARLRSGAAVPPQPRATEVFDASQVNQMIQTTLSKALLEDSARGRPTKRLRTPSPRRLRIRDAADEDDMEVRSDPRSAEELGPAAAASSPAERLPIRVDNRAAVGAKGALRSGMERTECRRTVGKRFSLKHWREKFEAKHIEDIPASREAMMEKALRVFVSRNPEWAPKAPGR